MALNIFNIGDVVQLNSGGPAMTVSGEASYGGVLCQWFDKNQDVKSKDFQEESLRKYVEPGLGGL